ncbi:MAG: class I SAM-dependent methyltransferase [Candidatus Omnitrophica bacterium]|nr:class I SAM-dependent methyltransferase [Candidatus Omnitrophota bacterium]
MKFFRDTFSPLSGKKILDVGGGMFNWNLIDEKIYLTIVNINIKDNELPRNDFINCVLGDGTKLPFKDNSFDIVFSNSVIEHLGTWERQYLFAKEIMRVGKNIFVQTPNKYFFIEPHVMTPFIHYLPKKIQKKIIRNFTLWGLITRPTKKYCAEQVIDKIRLLSCNEFSTLFPNCEIKKEKFLSFFDKSFYAIYKSDADTRG